MKKITLVLITVLASCNLFFAQTNLIVEAPLDNTTTQVRAPNGLSTYAYLRACALVMQSELTNIPSGSTLTLFGFTIASTTTMTIPVSGNFTVYLENTTNTSYLKGTTWSTIPGPMTQVFANVMTIPISTTASSIILTLSTPFVYTGGGLYVAYDWYSAGPFSTIQTTYFADGGASLNPGCASGNSASSAPTTLATTAFRPSFLFGFANPYTNDMQVIGLESPGKVNVSFNTGHNIKALIRNSSSTTQNNINVSLNVTGANIFANTQTITSMAPGTTSTVTFPLFNPQTLGANTVSVSVPPDQNNVNNSATYAQSVTCNEWAQNPASGSYTSNSVGFGTGSGILATPFLNPVASNLAGIRGAISNNAASTGKNVYGVLLSSTGATLATTNTITISTLSTFVTFTFATPQSLAANTTYYLGVAQTANATAYYPAGTQSTTYLPPNLYYSTGLAGGALTAITQNYGYFGLEGVFINNAGINATTSSTAICTGATATLSATGVSSYTWSIPGPTSQSITVTPATNTVYTVVGTNSIGCTVSTLVAIQVSPLPVTAISTTNTVCAGNPVTFTAGGAISYTWNTGSTPSSTIFTDSPLVTTTYVVTGSNNAGCTNTANVIVSVNSFSSMNAPTSTIICLGGSVTLNASGALSYTWNTGTSTVNTSSISETPLATGIFTVSGSNNLGCIHTRTVDITVNSFTPGITSPTAICMGQQITITSTGGSGTTYTWSNNFNGFAFITVSPTITTSYTVTSIGASNNCTGFNSTTITVNMNPTVIASPQRSVMCKGETNTLTATGASTYSWSTTSTNTSVVISPTANITYNYSVTGTNAAGCTSTAQVSVKVNGCTGLAEFTESIGQVLIFPNPGSGIINLSFENIENIRSIEIRNTLGELVLLQEVTTEEFWLDLQRETNGIYFLKINTSSISSPVFKIIKQ